MLFFLHAWIINIISLVKRNSALFFHPSALFTWSTFTSLLPVFLHDFPKPCLFTCQYVQSICANKNRKEKRKGFLKKLHHIYLFFFVAICFLGAISYTYAVEGDVRTDIWFSSLMTNEFCVIFSIIIVQDVTLA